MANASNKDKALVPQNGGALATFDYGEDAGGGFEQIGAKDLSIPFINILQNNSPQVEAGQEGFKAGLLFNTVTGELIEGDKGVPFLPCHIDSVAVEWTPRDKGGGLVAMHDLTSDVVKAAREELKKRTGKPFGKMALNGNDLVETHYVYGLTLSEDGNDVDAFAVTSWSSTKIGVYKDWTTAMFMIKGKPPLFANRARLKTFKDKNAKGSFFNFQVVPLIGTTWRESLINPQTGANLIAEAKHFREMVTSGKAKADFTQDTGSAAAADTEGNGKAPF